MYFSSEDRDLIEAGLYHGKSAMVMIFNQDDQVLLNHRDDFPHILYPDHWAIIGGSVDAGETSKEAAIREVKEEIGLEIDQIDFYTCIVDKDGDNHLVSVYYTYTETSIDDLILQEGTELAYFSSGELNRLKITPFIRDVLLDYYTISN